MIAIVDYNMGNLASVQNAFAKLGKETTIESNPEKFKDYDKLILPGVGAFGDAIEHLRERDMIAPLQEYAKSGKYMLGICLGMQLLFESSEEFGEHQGLGLIKGSVTHFDKNKFEENMKIPHMGWNTITSVIEHPVFNGIDIGDYFYFVHSFAAPISDFTAASCEYGNSFSAAIIKDNFIGCQFHPEKSQKAGLKFIQNFLDHFL